MDREKTSGLAAAPGALMISNVSLRRADTERAKRDEVVVEGAVEA